MKLPVKIEGHTIRDAEDRVIVSALNPCTDEERRQIVKALNGSKAASNVLESWTETEWMKASHHPNYNRRLLWAFHNEVRKALSGGAGR